MFVCPNCNKQFEENAKFCDACGTALAEVAETAEPVEAAEATETAEVTEEVEAVAVETEEAAEIKVTPKFNLPKLPFELDKKVLGIGAAAIAVIVVLAIIISAIFTGGEPNYSLYMKDGELMYYGMSGKPWQVSDDMESSGYLNLVSKDGDKIFFQQDGDLYYRNVKSKKDAEKLCTEVDFYMITEDGKRVIIMTDDGDLYIHNLKERTKIDSEIENLVGYSENFKKIVYLKDRTENDEGETEYDLYMYNGKKTVKLESGISSASAKKDLSTVYYVKNDDLYSKKGTRDGKKLDSDVSYIMATYEDGDLYYTKSEDEERSLCYFNGKKSVVVAEDIYGVEDGSLETPVLVYSVDNSDDDDEEWSLDYYVAIKDKSTAINEGDNFVFAEDGKSLYYLEPTDDESDTSDLYKIKISGKKVGKADKYDTDVSEELGVRVTEDGAVIYFKDYKDGEATLYKDKKEIQSDVYTSSVKYCAASKTLAYYIDYEDDSSGTLMFSKNGKKPTKVSEDVYSVQFTPDGQIMYLKDRSEKSGEGELYLNKLSKKSKKVDDDVRSLLRVYTWEEINN